MNTKDSNAARKNDDNKKTSSSGNTNNRSEAGKDGGRTAVKKSPAK